MKKKKKVTRKKSSSGRVKKSQKSKAKKVRRKTKTVASKKKRPSRSLKAKRAAAKTKLQAPPPHAIGVVTHYFPHVQAAVVQLKRPLKVGDSIAIKGRTTDFIQRIESMQIDHVPIQEAKADDEIGLRVDARVREHDYVLKAGS